MSHKQSEAHVHSAPSVTIFPVLPERPDGCIECHSSAPLPQERMEQLKASGVPLNSDSVPTYVLLTYCISLHPPRNMNWLENMRYCFSWFAFWNFDYNFNFLKERFVCSMKYEVRCVVLVCLWNIWIELWFPPKKKERRRYLWFDDW